MKKDYNIERYKETVRENNNFFKNYYYHSLIDLNLVKLDCILKYGILSKNLIERKNLISLYTHSALSFDSKNGYNYISLSEYTDKTGFYKMFESFSLHTLSSLSLMVNKNIEIEEKGKIETYFDDEIFCRDYISKEFLEGIILPDHLSNMKINEISCLPNDLECYTSRYINHWIEMMETYFKQEITRTEIMDSLDKLWLILEEYGSPEKWISSALQTQQKEYGKDLKDVLASVLHNLWSKKLQIKDPTYMDVLTSINKNELPVYEIKEKSLKKVKGGIK